MQHGAFVSFTVSSLWPVAALEAYMVLRNHDGFTQPLDHASVGCPTGAEARLPTGFFGRGLFGEDSAPPYLQKPLLTMSLTDTY